MGTPFDFHLWQLRRAGATAFTAKKKKNGKKEKKKLTFLPPSHRETQLTLSQNTRPEKVVSAAREIHH